MNQSQEKSDDNGGEEKFEVGKEESDRFFIVHGESGETIDLPMIVTSVVILGPVELEVPRWYLRLAQ